MVMEKYYDLSVFTIWVSEPWGTEAKLVVEFAELRVLKKVGLTTWGSEPRKCWHKITKQDHLLSHFIVMLFVNPGLMLASVREKFTKVSER